MLMFPCFSCDERTEHANSLDHAIALHLLKAAEDGSPLVRKELVVALQVGGSNPVLKSLSLRSIAVALSDQLLSS